MLKKLLLASWLSFLGSSAFAACNNPLPITSGGGSPGTVNMSVTQNPTDSSCMYNISLPFPIGTTASTLSAWNSSTTVNTTQTIMTSGSGALAATVELFQTSTLTSGAITYEGTYDGTFTDGPAGGGYPIPIPTQVLNPSTVAPLTNPYTLVASTNQPFLIRMQGYQAVRIRLSTVITGTGTVTPKVTLLPYDPSIGAALLSPIIWPLTTPPVQVVAGATGGASSCSLLVATASTNSTSCKTSLATVYEFSVVQTTTTLGDLRLYDSATAPTCSSATGLIGNWPVQSNAVSPGMSISFGPVGRVLVNGLGFCFTGAVANNDNTNWGGTANGVSINIGYK